MHTQLPSSIVFKCLFSKSSKKGNKSYNLLAFDPSLVWNGANLCFCDKSQAIIAQFDPDLITSWPRKKKADKYLTYR